MVVEHDHPGHGGGQRGRAEGLDPCSHAHDPHVVDVARRRRRDGGVDENGGPRGARRRRAADRDGLPVVDGRRELSGERRQHVASRVAEVEVERKRSLLEVGPRGREVELARDGGERVALEADGVVGRVVDESKAVGSLTGAGVDHADGPGSSMGLAPAGDDTVDHRILEAAVGRAHDLADERLLGGGRGGAAGRASQARVSGRTVEGRTAQQVRHAGAHGRREDGIAKEPTPLHHDGHPLGFVGRAGDERSSSGDSSRVRWPILDRCSPDAVRAVRQPTL
jgi:hypothetical protein